MHNVAVTKHDDSEVEIKGELDAPLFEAHRAEAVKHLSASKEIPGFRKGHTPADILERHLGPMVILEEMAERALGKHYPEILSAHKIDAIGEPRITITKIAKGSPLGFTIRTAVFPAFELPDYKKTAAEYKDSGGEITVDEKELSDAIETLRKSRAKKNEDGSEGPLPELTDEFVKTLGNFDNVAAFKEKLSAHLKEEKEAKRRQKKRIAIMDAILAKTSIAVPRIMVERELYKMTAQFEGDVGQMGITLDDYLKHIKKTREELRASWQADAEKNCKVQLVLGKIAGVEKIAPDPARVEKETAALLTRYKDADPARASEYVAGLLTNEEVFSFLERMAEK